MIKRETNAWSSFNKRCLGRIRFWRVENQLTSGMSDAIGINPRGVVFWIETKALEEWPKRDSTIPLRSSFEKGQIPFLKEWISNNGNGFVLLKAEKEWFLLNPIGRKFGDLVELTQAQIRYDAVMTGVDQIVNYLESLRNEN